MAREMSYSDGIGHRNRQHFLLCGGPGDSVNEFKGTGIPGVVAVKTATYTKNGKWSHTDYTLLVSETAWALTLSQSWEEGLYFAQAASVADVMTAFRTAGYTGTDEFLAAFLTARMPKTMERIRSKEEELRGIQ